MHHEAPAPIYPPTPLGLPQYQPPLPAMQHMEPTQDTIQSTMLVNRTTNSTTMADYLSFKVTGEFSDYDSANFEEEEEVFDPTTHHQPAQQFPGDNSDDGEMDDEDQSQQVIPLGGSNGSNNSFFLIFYFIYNAFSVGLSWSPNNFSPGSAMDSNTLIQV
jgi:hypothetical protein